MFRLYLVLLLLISGYLLKAQDSLIIHQNKISGVNMSYFAEYYTHYGLKIGIEYPLWTNEKIKHKKNLKEIHKNKLLFLTGNVGLYIHQRNHAAFFINSEIGYRKIRNKGMKYECFFGIGYLHTFLQGDTYRVNDDGSVERVNLAGQSNLMTSLSVGIGYDFNSYYHKPFSIFIKPGFFIQYPFGTAIAVRPTIDAGIFYYFNHE